MFFKLFLFCVLTYATTAFTLPEFESESNKSIRIGFEDNFIAQGKLFFLKLHL